MKRKYVMSLVSIFAASISIGCLASAADLTADLTFAWWGSQTRTERTQAALDLYSSEHDGITFDTQTSDFSDYWAKLATSAAGNALPELMQMDYTRIKEYTTNGLLADLTPYIDKGLLDVSDISEGIVASGSIDGKVYAICNGVNAPSLLYNKTLMDDLGIEVKDNMTLDEFMSISKEVYETTGVKTMLPYVASDNFLPYTLRADGITDLFGDGSAFTVEDGSVFERFFEIYQTGTEEGWALGADFLAEVTPGTVEESPMIYYSTPSTQTWCVFFWSNQMAAMVANAPEDMEIGITTWPSDNPVASNFLKPSQFFSVTRDAGENEEEAVKVLDFLINSVEANEILLGERGVPAPSDVAEAISPLLDEASQTVVTYINDVVTPNCSPISPANPEGASEVYSYVEELLEMVQYGEMNAQEAAAELFTHGNEILGR